MKVDTAALSFINDVATTAKMFGIDSVIIEPGRVRGLDGDGTVAFLQTVNVPDMPFGSIGINRIDTFASRYALLRGLANFEMDVTVEGTKDSMFARTLTLKGKNTKVEYRCANPAMIRAPKQIADTPRYHSAMTSEAVAMIVKAASAMDAEEVVVAATGERIRIEFADVNSDKFTHELTTTVVALDATDEDPILFANKYPVKLIQTAFKGNPSATFTIGRRGVLIVNVNGIDTYIFPRK